jgi:hypothetical protein
MIREKGYLILFFTFLIIAVFLFNTQTALTQTWQALPPYNILWPLWSPLLSPVNPITGLPTPLVSELSRNTILPMQPCLGLNPNNPIVTPMGDYLPYFFYNTPTGLAYFDVWYGLNPWPPSSFVNPVTGAPIPLSLATGYSFLPLPNLRGAEFGWIVDVANLSYLAAYGAALAVNPASLLSYADIWGLPAI